MAYPLDQEKWQRVRQMLERQDLDAVVVRAPDNVLYLTNYWTMKGYDLAIFPREGDPTLLVIEPQFREAQLTAWNKDVRFFRFFYHPRDPRPPMIRAVEMAVDVLRERKLSRRVGIELSQTSQICDRMVGEPTVLLAGFLRCFSRRLRRSRGHRATAFRIAHDQNAAGDRAHAAWQTSWRPSEWSMRATTSSPA